MKHRGEIIETVVRNSGISINHLAKQLHKSRQYVYTLFENPNVPVETIVNIGKIIHYDFSKDFKDLITTVKKYKAVQSLNAANENDSNYRNVDYWKSKYYELLEQHNQLLKQIINKKV